jgi:hypothetical protein
LSVEGCLLREFLKPFAALNTAQLTFKPEGDRTVVTSRTLGEKNFLAKTIGLFMNMNKMIGGQSEQGLARRSVGKPQEWGTDFLEL